MLPTSIFLGIWGTFLLLAGGHAFSYAVSCYKNEEYKQYPLSLWFYLTIGLSSAAIAIMVLFQVFLK